MALAPTELIAAKEDIDGVMTAALDYIDGYISGDAERHARAYHPECIKRRYVSDESRPYLTVLCFLRGWAVPSKSVDLGALSHPHGPTSFTASAQKPSLESKKSPSARTQERLWAT